MYDVPSYYPHTAQKKYLLRRSYCHRGMYRKEETIAYINEKLKATWSPEQIAGAKAPEGSNENSNGLLREFYPKGRNLSRVSQKTLDRGLVLINARHRKVLNFISAADMWNSELSAL